MALSNLLQQLATAPGFAGGFQQGQQLRQEQIDRELRRDQIKQQMEAAELQERIQRSRYEEEFSDPFVQSRLQQAMGQAAMGQAQAETAVPLAQAQLQQQQVAAQYAEPEAQMSLKRGQAAINSSNASTALSHIQAQRQLLELRWEQDPQNLELKQELREAELAEARLKKIQHQEAADYFRSTSGEENRDAQRQAELHESLATIETVVEAKKASTALTKAQAEKVQRELEMEEPPEDVQRLSETPHGRELLAARALEKKLRQDPSDINTARELAATYQSAEKYRTITGMTEVDARALSEPKVDALLEVRDNTTSAITEVQEMRDALVEDPTRGGLVGTFRRGAQTVLGIGTDLSSFLGTDFKDRFQPIMNKAAEMAKKDVAVGNMDAETYANLFDPTLAEVPTFENRMAYFLARSRGGTGRLSVQELDRARKEVAITGLKSTQDVVYRLNRILRELEASKSNLDYRIDRQKGEGTKQKPNYTPGQQVEYHKVVEKLMQSNPKADKKTLIEFAKSKGYLPEDYSE